MRTELPRWLAMIPASAAVVVTAFAWLQDPPDLVAREAAEVATAAFAEARLEGVRVAEEVSAGLYDGTIPIWRTTATLDGGTVELWVARSDGAPLYLDDRTDDGARHLLTAAEFDALSGFDDNPALDRRLRRNLALTLAGALAAAISTACVSVRRSSGGSGRLDAGFGVAVGGLGGGDAVALG